MIIGHERVLRFLNKALEEAAPMHGFLFSGPEGVGKRTVALSFAKGLLCEKKEFGGCDSCKNCKEFKQLAGTHRDLLYLVPNEEEAYGIETSRRVKEFLASRPQLAMHHIVVVDQADELTSQGQNALLKILEEPPAYAVLVLVTAKPGRLYETLRSRLIPVRFGLASHKQILSALDKMRGLTATVKEKIARFALGRQGRALLFAEDAELLAREEKLIMQLSQLPCVGVAERFDFIREALPHLKRIFPYLHLVLRDKILIALGKSELALVINTEHKSMPTLGLAEGVELLRRSLNAASLIEDTATSPRLVFENFLLGIKKNNKPI